MKEQKQDNNLQINNKDNRIGRRHYNTFLIAYLMLLQSKWSHSY